MYFNLPKNFFCPRYIQIIVLFPFSPPPLYQPLMNKYEQLIEDKFNGHNLSCEETLILKRKLINVLRSETCHIVKFGQLNCKVLYHGNCQRKIF